MERLTAIAFPGQGAQSVEMGRDIYEAYPEAREIFDLTDKRLGRPLTALMFEGPFETLSETVNTQLAVYCLNHICFELAASRGIKGDFFLGHSLGEYNALTSAGVVDFETGLKLVEKRAALMQEAATKHPGAMFAVLGLPDDEVERQVDKAVKEGGVAVVANYNCPGQTVVSGDIGTMTDVRKACEQAGARKVIELKVSGGFHSSLMSEAADSLSVIIDSVMFNKPKVPVASNFTGRLSTDPGVLKDALKRQMTGSVRWTVSVREVIEAGADRFVETGPGTVLSGLIRRIAGDAVETINVNSAESMEGLS